MTSWFRSRKEFFCGSCGTLVPEGSPCFAVTLPLVKRLKVRCESCAFEPKPAVLPDTPDAPIPLTHVDEDGILRPGPAPMSPLREAMGRVLDYKSKASGE